jgi:hypothetical protein
MVNKRVNIGFSEIYLFMRCGTISVVIYLRSYFSKFSVVILASFQ